MDEGSAALETSTCCLSGLRFSFRFSCMEGVLRRRGKPRKDHNCRSQHKLQHPRLPRFWSWKLAGPQIRLPGGSEGTPIQHLPSCSAGLDKSKSGTPWTKNWKDAILFAATLLWFRPLTRPRPTPSQSGFGVRMRGWGANSPPCAARLLDGLDHRHRIRSKPPCKSRLSPNFDLHLIVDNLAVVSR